MSMTGVRDLLKFKDLSRRLGITPTHTLGVLETIWTYCHQHAYDRRGCLFSASELGMMCDWAGDDHHLILALTDSRWMDKTTDRSGLVYPHDYWDHAPQFVKRRIERFQGGRLAIDAEKRYLASQKADMTSQKADMTIPPDPTRPNLTQPNQTKIHKPPVTPLVKPNQKAEAERSVSTAEIFKKAGVGKQRSYVDEIMSLCGDKEGLRPWWVKVVTLHRDHDLLSELHDDLAHIRDCQNPVTRQAKDLGSEFTAPNRWLAAQCKKRLGSLPRFPREAVK